MNFIAKGVKTEKKKKPVPISYDVDPAPQPTLEPPADLTPAAPVAPVYMETPAPAPQPSSYANANSMLFEQPSLSSTGQFNDALSGPTLGSRNILVVVPNTNQDIRHIVDNLQNAEACVVNLETIPFADAQRRLDFLSGVICAIGGTIRPLDQNKYILTPQGLGVKG
ncbi:MAG: cell division protein SepF [Firmicutes bacterium]|nr:cell division protein SepF [Bacillota bacterium]